MNMKSVITERGKARSDPTRVMMMISVWVCVWVGEATSESYPQSICAHFPPTLRHPGTEMNVHITGISRSGEAYIYKRVCVCVYVVYYILENNLKQFLLIEIKLK